MGYFKQPDIYTEHVVPFVQTGGWYLAPAKESSKQYDQNNQKHEKGKTHTPIILFVFGWPGAGANRYPWFENFFNRGVEGRFYILAKPT